MGNFHLGKSSSLQSSQAVTAKTVEVLGEVFNTASGPFVNCLLAVIHNSTLTCAEAALRIITLLGSITIKEVMAHSHVVSNFMSNSLKWWKERLIFNIHSNSAIIYGIIIVLLHVQQSCHHSTTHWGRIAQLCQGCKLFQHIPFQHIHIDCLWMSSRHCHQKICQSRTLQLFHWNWIHFFIILIK